MALAAARIAAERFRLGRLGIDASGNLLGFRKSIAALVADVWSTGPQPELERPRREIRSRAPASPALSGCIRKLERLGGLLRFYERTAA